MPKTLDDRDSQIWEATTAKRMKIDPYDRQNCRLRWYCWAFLR